MCVCASVTRHPTSLNLALIIGLAALALLLLLLCIALTICLSAVSRRRRRRTKATDGVDFQTTPSSSTVSVNLSPSSSSCSRTSETSADSDAEAPPAPPLPPPPPVLPTAFDSRRPVAATPPKDVSDIPTVVIKADKVGGVGTGVGAGGAGRPSWTQSMPSVVVAGVFSPDDVRKVPPMIAKKTAKAHATAARISAQTSSPSSEQDSVDISVTTTSADPLPGLGPERPRPAGPRGRYVHIPPKLHREPRGWAPASHAVPAPVKRTWGRAKAKLAAERDLAGVTVSSPSLTDCDENDVGSSTLSLM